MRDLASCEYSYECNKELAAIMRCQGMKISVFVPVFICIHGTSALGREYLAKKHVKNFHRKDAKNAENPVYLLNEFVGAALAANTGYNSIIIRG